MSNYRAERLQELRPFVAEARRLTGWTFAYEPVPLGPPEPWDYTARARELAGGAGSVLDLGTGGGEVLERILRGCRGRAIATEAWPPNVAVANRRLGQLGVRVVHASSLALPFAGESFDLVLDRHEELSPPEVARVLRPAGRVLTQQVHPQYHDELRAYFPRLTVFERHDEGYPRGLAAAGLMVLDSRQHSRPVAYRELGHLVYALVAAPWLLPDFDLEADLDSLLAVERELGGPEGIVLSDPSYILEARKRQPGV